MQLSQRKIQILKYVAAAFLFAIAGVLQYVDSFLPIVWNNVCAYLASIIFFSLGIFWAISVKSRIINKNLRIGLVLTAFLFILLLLLRIIKYDFFPNNDTVNRYLWYAYYIPQCLAPVVMFLSVLNIERKDKEPMKKAWFLLFVPAIILILFVMTNDYHQLVFSFRPNFEYFSSIYKHEFMYYVTMAWIVGMTIASIGILINKCRVSACRKKIWIPILTFAVCFGFCIWVFLGNLSSYKIPESIGLTFILLFESCIQIGLIQSNSEYKKYFDSADITAFIADNDYVIKYRANNAPETDTELLKSITEQGNTYGDTRFRKKTIHGGTVYWTENMSTINRLNKELEEIGNRLDEENELIAAENKLREQKTHVEEQNRLYDGIAKIVRPTLDKINRLLAQLDEKSENYEQQLKLVCIYGAYIKRRSNLAVIGENAKRSNLSEFDYAVRESMRYLSSYGIKGSFIGSNEEKSLANETVVLLYDFVEECIEKALPNLTAIIINFETKKNVFICRVSLDGATEKIDCNWQEKKLEERKGRIKIISEDGTDYVTLELTEESL